MAGPQIAAERVERAWQCYENCCLCHRRCGVNRIAGEVGFCGAGTTARVHRHRVEFGEELELIPSHLFYLSGCDLRCAFCIGEDAALFPEHGTVLASGFFQEAIAWGRARGAKTLQWVGGEPTIHLPTVLAVMAEAGPLPPVIWKSNFHATPEVWPLLDGLVDVYVADFKFGCNACAQRIAGVDHYVEIVQQNLEIAAAQGRLIVRHLLLPGHFDCCFRPIVAWLRHRLPSVPLSLRDGYLPCWQAGRFAELASPLDRNTARRAQALAADAGLQLVT